MDYDKTIRELESLLSVGNRLIKIGNEYLKELSDADIKPTKLAGELVYVALNEPEFFREVEK